ncbi:MAG: septation regulator SpoVG [Clostridia bacterium]|nr:septation regulator SpoVG [Clostridia bacterium]
MNISDIRIRLMPKADSMLKAVASFTIDECFVVHDVKIIDGSNGYFVAMPSKKGANGDYRDIVHPLNTETRERLSALILAEYEKAVANGEDK